MDRIQMHKELCEELNKTYEKKNHDYGNSFGETFEKLGIISAVTRISVNGYEMVFRTYFRQIQQIGIFVCTS